MKSKYSDTFRAMGHTIEFYYNLPRETTGDEIELLKEEAERRAREMIAQDYTSGELNYESESLWCTGWWNIEV